MLKVKNSPAEDSWHNWHKPEWEQSSESEVFAVAEQQNQQQPKMSPLESVVVAEQHHSDQELQLTPQSWKQFLTAIVAVNAPVHGTVTDGAEVVAVTWDIPQVTMKE